MLISKTPKQFKDRWQTLIEVFRALDAEFHFKLDAATDDNNALCKTFLSEEGDALKCDWNSDGAIFCNPPYSNIQPWVNKAAEQCRKQKKDYCDVTPFRYIYGLVSRSAIQRSCSPFYHGGRLSFINAQTGKKGKAGNSKGSVLFIWRPMLRLGCSIMCVQRKELLKRGVE